MMKKILGTLLIGAFVFGLGASDVKVASAAILYKTPTYTQHKPKTLKRTTQREQDRTHPHSGKTKRFSW